MSLKRKLSELANDYCTHYTGVPRCIQMDRGTENVLVEDIQVAFHSVYGNPDGHCVIKSASPHNQVSLDSATLVDFVMRSKTVWIGVFL